MNTLTFAAIVLVALLHLCFLVLEMFLWAKPTGLKIFHLQPEFARQSASLAANQGLYNGFLSAGLLWGLWQVNTPVLVFFLGFIIIAGIYGALTANRIILWLQTLPAGVALALLLLSEQAADIAC